VKGRTPREAAFLGARELIGPVIAMTITLAAVYTPIGLQGGLTGALFREFALTLAGAVTISGIVALTLSPMMAANLLRSADEEERGFTGWVNHHFDRLRQSYGRTLRSTLNARPFVYAIWGVVSVLAFFMYQFSPKELAPTEDKRVIFGIINSSANATADQNIKYARAAEEVLRKVPEADLTFQLMFPPSNPFAAAQGVTGFSGVVLKPWHAPRKRTVFEVLPEIQDGFSRIPGLQIFAATPPALPGGSNFPVEFVIASTADPKSLLEFGRENSNEGHGKRDLFLPAVNRPEVRSTAGGSGHRPGKSGHARIESRPGGRRSFFRARRQLRQPFQYCRPQL